MTRWANPLVAIACGGTGGHLFPGLSVAQELARRGGEVELLISPKEVDQLALGRRPGQTAPDQGRLSGDSSACQRRGAQTVPLHTTAYQGMEVCTLPAVGLDRDRVMGFLKGFWKGYATAHRLFHRRPPQAVLGMGGFTSAPAVLAGKRCGAATFLHESNTIPGRANRWLSHVVDQAFVGFPSAANRLYHQEVVTTGTPVRQQFQPVDASSCRGALGLDANRPMLLVMGGSQGATAINDIVLAALPELVAALPDLQFVHLTGPKDAERIRTGYHSQGCRALVQPFLTEMELALGAATVAVSRAGASSLAELAAMRVPAILIPYPSAADNHQYHNARAFADSGAALLTEQSEAKPGHLKALVARLVQDATARQHMASELERWHAPNAASLIADKIIRRMQVLGLASSDTMREPCPLTPALSPGGGEGETGRGRGIAGAVLKDGQRVAA